jgi:hypothetical protein
MSKMKFVVGISAMLALVGCNSVSGIGSVGDVQYHVVRSTDLVGPSAAVIVRENPNGTQDVVASFGSDGILPAGITATGNVVAAEVYDEAGDNVSVSGNVNVKQNNGTRHTPLSDRPPL